MPGPDRMHLSDLRGAARMAVDAAVMVTRVVERLHHTIQRRPGPLGQAVTGGTRGITGLVYRSVRGGMRLVGQGLDAGLESVIALLPDGESTPARDAFLSAVNGVYGDYLARTGNPLAIEMSLRHRGRPAGPDHPAGVFDRDANAAPTGRLLVLAHGLCLDDLQWTRDGHDHGAALASELGYTPLYLRYNSGLHIATNGRDLAEALETLVARWPRPVEELAIIGHSMGGLVARSACHHAPALGHHWPRYLHKLVFLGTPHHGAPLERGGHWLDFIMELSPYSAPFARIGKLRSAGITDLRHGTTTSGPHVHVPLPDGVKCYAAAASLGTKRGIMAGRLVGDGLVPLDSALGRHRDAARSLAIPEAHRWIGEGMGHLDLLSRPEVYAQLREWMKA